MITLDTTRADAIDAPNTDECHTPNLTRLGMKGTSFTNAYSLIPITLPSHATMFYSLPPHKLRLYNNGQISTQTLPALAQLMQQNGFHTAAVISLKTVASEFRLNKGFAIYSESFQPFLWKKIAADVNREAFALIPQQKGNKCFFWLHYSDSHAPYFISAYKEKFLIELNGQPVFSCLSTQQPVAELHLDCPPGRNTLRFETEIPAQMAGGQPFPFTYISFEKFKLTAAPGADLVSIVYPAAWRRVVNHPDGSATYHTESPVGDILIDNRSKQSVAFTLEVALELNVTKESKPQFYRQEMDYMDARIGELLDFLKEQKMFDQSAFIFIGDHGEGLGEKDRHIGHIHFLNKIYTHVPLILFGKGIKPRGAKTELVSPLDIAPTIADLAGFSGAPFWEGRSLLKKIKNSRLLLATYTPEAFFDGFSIIDFPYQVIYYPGRGVNHMEWINLQQSPFGLPDDKDIGIDPQLKEELFRAVSLAAKMVDFQRKNNAPIPADMQLLKSLGYL